MTNVLIGLGWVLIWAVFVAVATFAIVKYLDWSARR